MADILARALWERYEPVHDLLYFAPEARRAADGLGLRGFWMGYFALRAAPLGPVAAPVVASSFYVFHPDRVARALPDAWRYADPADVLAARREAMDAAMTRVFGREAVTGPHLAEAADLAWEAAAAADTAGRVLAAANQALDRPAPPHLRLWQALTTLREHRGDGHVAVLVSQGIGPVAAMVLKAAAGESDATLLREGRKWDLPAWRAAQADLRARGWLGEDGGLTAAGTAVRAEVEAATDAAAEQPWTALGADRAARLAGLLEPLAKAVLEAGLLPSGNPVGLTGDLWNATRPAVTSGTGRAGGAGGASGAGEAGGAGARSGGRGTPA
ncbi:SCO6745 family protein [Streptomyces mexicanus]|uniref:SCO6745 family protein n=1 Tax=Streptomyces mexicanus TaxID=178566 RepID=UPI003675506B